MGTPASLLERLRQPDPEQAWTRFVQLYTPLLFRWPRRIGLRDGDAADLLQTVTQKEELSFSLALNFDLQSDDVQQLRAWINISADELQRAAERILYNSIGLRGDEAIHG